MRFKLKHQLALSATKSSLFLSLPIILLLLSGCSGSGSQGSVQPPAGSSAQNVEEQALSPAAIAFSRDDPRLSMRMLDAEVKLGISLDEAKKLFPRPGRSFPIQEIPAGLDSQFDVTGWEQGPLSVGMISAKGRVALFLEIQDRADEASALERVAEISGRQGLPTATVTHGSTRYWFWEAPGERIMVCLSPNGAGRHSLSSALGSPVLMTTLRMSPQLAEEDAIEAEKLFRVQPKDAAGQAVPSTK